MPATSSAAAAARATAGPRRFRPAPYLLLIPSVAVLLFALGRPVVPVDTHVHRVARRLGLIEREVDAERAHALMTALGGDDARDAYALHVGLVRHGRRVCHARRPECGMCPLAPMCPSAGLV